MTDRRLRAALPAVFLLVLLLLQLTGQTFPAVEAAAEDSAAQRTVEEIIAAQSGGDAEKWISEGLAEGIGVTSEWYAIVLSQLGRGDLTAYGEALAAYLGTGAGAPPATRQKYALALAACGRADAYIAQTLADSIGAQGIMTLCFGLHLLNNGYVSREKTAAGVAAEILALQLEDGGWAVSGTAGNADVTAMILQALAPQGADEKIAAAIARGVDRLSALQLPSGGYHSYGTENCESAAQVIIALSALGIDCETDARFIKNGHTLWGVLDGFRVGDGAYAHVSGGEANASATVQVFCAAGAYLRLGRGSLYVLDAADPSAVPELPAVTTPSGTETGKADAPGRAWGYKPIAAAALLVLAAVVCAVMALCRVKRRGNYLLVVLVAALAIAGVLLTNFESAGDHYSRDFEREITGQITFSIVGVDADGAEKEIFAARTVGIGDGDTVWNILDEVCTKNKIQIEISGRGAGIYVRGIAGLYEFDRGDLSGWVYFVNGEKPSVGAGACPVRDGDTVEWRYEY